MNNDLNTLLTTLYVLLDDRILPGIGLSRTHVRGRKPQLPDAKLLCLIVAHHLLVALRTLGPATESSRLDDLDQRRRFEFVHPAVGLELALALASPVEACARELVRIAERQLASGQRYPARAVVAVRRRLGWED